jgi:hypothetical protein
MDRNYIIYNNHPFTLIWHLAFGDLVDADVGMG